MSYLVRCLYGGLVLLILGAPSLADTQPGYDVEWRDDMNVDGTSSDGAFSIGLGVGTTGLELYGTKRVSPRTDLVLAYQTLDYDRNHHDSRDNLYAMTLDIDAYKLGVRWRVSPNSGWHVEIGAFSDAPTIYARAVPNAAGNYIIRQGGQEMPVPAAVVGRVTGEARYDNSIAPYLLLGWQQVTNHGVAFNANLGVIDFGTPKTTLRHSGGTLPPDQTALFRLFLDEEEAELDEDIDEFDLYPVLRFGLGYVF